MTSCLAAVAAAVPLLLIILYLGFKRFQRKRLPGEPPIVEGSLLFGNATEFSSHAVRFLHRCHCSFGDVFTIRLINQYMTIIVDPHSYETFCRHKNLDFEPIQRQVNWNVFSFVLKEPKVMIRNTGKTVAGLNLVKSLQSFSRNLDDSCQRFLEHETSKRNAGYVNSASKNEERRTCEEGLVISEGLRLVVARTIFVAIFNSIFGSPRNDEKDTGFIAESIYRSFETFHKYFNYFWLGLPKWLFPEAMESLRNLLQMPDTEQLLLREDLSAYIRTAINCMVRQGQTESDVKGHNLVYLHVNYNTFRLAFWALAHLLEDRKAYAALEAEVNDCMASNYDADSKTVRLTVADINDMQVLNSVVQETCRLASGVFVVRYVTEDTWFTTDNGESFLLRKGDRAAIYPPTIHKDPEIFASPDVFQYDRFVGGTTFFKNGKELKHPVLAFGSLCPGKNFALFELKWYLISMFSRFEMELAEGQRAEYDFRYHGHEVLPPVADVAVHLIPKKNVPVLELC